MIKNKNLHKVILTRNTVLNLSDVTTVLSRKLLIVKQNEIGGWKLLLGANLIGDVPLNELPFAETLIETIVTDENVYCYSELSAEFNSGGGQHNEIDLSNYLNKQESDARYLFKTALHGYASESWVNNRGYLTASSLIYYPTKTEVINLINTAGNFEYNQATPSESWNIQHNLNRYPSVTIMVGGSLSHGQVDYIDRNNVRISFNGAYSGIASFN